MPADKEQINARVVMCGRNPSGVPVALALDADGNPSVSASSPGGGTVSSPTLSNIASSASSQQALAVNSDRRGLMAYNDDANTCLLKYGATASATSYTVAIPSAGYFEMPLPIYTGRIDVIWLADGSGSLRITES